MSRMEEVELTNMCMVYDDDGNVLVQDKKHPTWNGWNFPGGHVEAGEAVSASVVREVYEETGVHYEIDRLAIIHENFFNQHEGSLKGLNCHEICFYFLMKPKGNQKLNSNSFTSGHKEQMYWIPIKDLDKYRTFPYFFKDYLKTQHNEVVHIVTDDRK